MDPVCYLPCFHIEYCCLVIFDPMLVRPNYLCVFVKLVQRFVSDISVDVRHGSRRPLAQISRLGSSALQDTLAGDHDSEPVRGHAGSLVRSERAYRDVRHWHSQLLLFRGLVRSHSTLHTRQCILSQVSVRGDQVRHQRTPTTQLCQQDV